MKSTTVTPGMTERMPPRRFRARRLLALAALLGALSLTLAACGGDSGGDAKPPPDYAKDLRGAPPKLAALYTQGDVLLDGGTEAYDKQLAAVRGYPVVVNKWASWCGPCREEFPLFQQESARRGDEIAFLGWTATTPQAAAKTFLDERPLPYPSISDPGEDVAQESLPGRLSPTAFYDSSGKLTHVNIGPYTPVADLDADVNRYAGGG